MMNIFPRSKENLTKSENSNSATVAYKMQIKHFENTKMTPNSFLSIFILKGIILPYFPYILFLEKNKFRNHFKNDFEFEYSNIFQIVF